ncbi:MAG: hypothetical protein K9G33_07615 [Sneathiella sp.]|nr:hypothetical protein [Sneathiella sp.]
MLEIAARLHAFLHGLFRPTDEAETRMLYGKVVRLFVQTKLDAPRGRELLIETLTEYVLDSFGCRTDHPQKAIVSSFISRVFDYEGLFILPRVDWRDRHTITEYWEIRDQLNTQRSLLEDFDANCHLLQRVVIECLEPIYIACPALLAVAESSQDITVQTNLLRSIANIPDVTERLLTIPFAEELEKAELLSRHRERLDRNLIIASGGNPVDPKGFNRLLKMPGKSEIKDPGDMIGTYLGGTPLKRLFDQTIDFTLPTKTRFEHHHIVAGSGHGKTQTLQYLIAKDLEAVTAGERSVIVLDSQGDLIRNISSLDEFAPGGSLRERIVIIDPTDVEWPVSLNLFDVGIDRLREYEPLERERLTNSILELYDFVLGSLLSAEMTQKQNVIFR